MTAKTTGIRTFEVVVNVSIPLAGTIDDWPASIQDGILGALEAKAQEVQLPLVVVASRCDVDHDVPKGQPGHYYVHVIASEVVAADERTLLPGTVAPRWH